jgi:hypothetical protein
VKPDEYLIGELAKCHARWKMGFKPALIDALRLCGLNNIPLPHWVYEHTFEHVLEAYAGKRKSKGRRGYSGGISGSVGLDARHFFRWDRASYWLKNRKSLLHPRATRLEAFKAAELQLADEKSPARTSAASIERSFDRVEKAVRSGCSDRFFLAAGLEPPASIVSIKRGRAEVR